MGRNASSKRLCCSAIVPLCVLLASSSACQTAPRSARTGERNVSPGFNDSLREGDVELWVGRFEGESREVYAQRERITAALGLKPGMVVADVGAGTGFFTMLFAEAVGADGAVYAADIVPAMLELIMERAEEKKLTNIQTVLCTDDSAELPVDKVDFTFICATYHHFEYPSSTMATIYEAMKPGSELVIIDIKRIEGESSDWAMKHMRAGQEGFTKEIEAAGFELIDDGSSVDYLKESYMIRFRRE